MSLLPPCFAWSTARYLRNPFLAFCPAVVQDGFNKPVVRFFRQLLERGLPARWASSKFCNEA